MSVIITTPSSSYQLATVAQFKEMQGVTTNNDDDVIASFIDRASAQITSYCGHSFGLETITETMASRGDVILKTSKYPINAVTSIALNSFDGAGFVTVSPALYSVDQPEMGYIYNDDGWQYTAGRFGYKVVYTTGYILPNAATGTPNLPYDITATCLELVAITYAMCGIDRNIIKEGSPDIGDITYAGAVKGALTPAQQTISVLSTLNSYRRFNI